MNVNYKEVCKKMQNSKQIEAFNRYFEYTSTGMKVRPAIQKIKKEFGVSEKTVYNWRNNFQWDKRATERSIKLNKELAQDIQNQADKAVKDYKKPFISILNRLIKQCIHNNQVEIKTPKELVTVMETVIKLQKELDMHTTNIISSEYSREKHVKEINSLLKELQHESISTPKTEAEESLHDGDALENGLQDTENHIMG